MGTITDMRGRTFGRLTIPKDANPVMRGGHAYWPVVCGCHARKLVRGSKLRDGTTISCGCWRADPDVRHGARVGPGPEDHEDEALEQYFEPPDQIEDDGLQWAPPDRHREIRSRREEQEMEEAEEYMNARLERAPDALDELISRAPAGPAERPEPLLPDPGKPEEEDWL